MECFVKALSDTTIATRHMKRIFTVNTDHARLVWSVGLAAPKASSPKDS